jgi:hypothetical protein
MSEKIIPLNDLMKKDAKRNRAHPPTATNQRVQWLAALVSAILDAENLKASPTVKKLPET